MTQMDQSKSTCGREAGKPLHGWCHVHKRGIKNVPTKEIKRYGLKFIAFRNASVNFTAVSQTTSLVTHWIFIVFALCSFLGKTWSPWITWIPWSTRLQGVWRVIIFWSMHRHSYCACLLFRDQGYVCVLCLHQGQINKDDISHPSSVNSWRTIEWCRKDVLFLGTAGSLYH